MHNGVTADTGIVTEKIPLIYKIKNGDILFSWSATLEVMYWTGGIGGLNQHIFKVIPKIANASDYCYRQIENYIVVFKQIADARKTTMGHITTDHLNQSRIAIPTNDVLNKYSKIISPFITQYVAISHQNTRLKLFKEFLLPLLMNGQVTVI